MASTSSCCGRRSTPSRRTGRISDPDAIVAALEGAVDLSEARILHGAQGPFYGAPVDDDKGYSGRQRMVFPPGGLPHPESATDGPCGERPRPRCPNGGARPASSTRYGTSRSPTTGRTSGPATPRTWNSSSAAPSTTRRGRRSPPAGRWCSKPAISPETTPSRSPGSASSSSRRTNSTSSFRQGRRCGRRRCRHTSCHWNTGSTSVFLSNDAAAEVGLAVQPALLLGQLAGTPTQQEQNARARR
jgi:hypothetical protein